jgi:acetyltransferase-like isoleucine patch superfamily enzyme
MGYLIKFILLNIICPAIPHPALRSRYLKLLGARIGKNVRIDNIRFIEIQGAIANLHCSDNVSIGSNVVLDLSAPVSLGVNTIVGSGSTLMTHQDLSDRNGSRLPHVLPEEPASITIGDDVVVGCDTTVLAGARIGAFTVIGARSLVLGSLPGNALFAGSPARSVKTLKE